MVRYQLEVSIGNMLISLCHMFVYLFVHSHKALLQLFPIVQCWGRFLTCSNLGKIGELTLKETLTVAACSRVSCVMCVLFQTFSISASTSSFQNLKGF